ncbi:hypothetical protein DY000_02053669 [Brassica cretica]|uniref:Uncharacterized protein n=1 Tax=Brassica cretica TaxID=69181 RepID=A0ABQ7AM78_BRACR|nr:hypothetical protein DY000_02053669 [Brassica cretica]
MAGETQLLKENQTLYGSFKESKRSDCSVGEKTQGTRPTTTARRKKIWRCTRGCLCRAQATKSFMD